jgi:hypothetical protein
VRLISRAVVCQWCDESTRFIRPTRPRVFRADAGSATIAGLLASPVPRLEDLQPRVLPRLAAPLSRLLRLVRASRCAG